MNTVPTERQMMIGGEAFVPLPTAIRRDSLNGYHEIADLVPAEIFAAMEERERLVQGMIDTIGIEYADMAEPLQQLFQLENFVVISGAAAGTAVRRGPASELMARMAADLPIMGSKGNKLTATCDDELRDLSHSPGYSRENVVPAIRDHMVRKGRELNTRFSMVPHHSLGTDPYYSGHGLAKDEKGRRLGYHVPFSARTSAYGIEGWDSGLNHLQLNFLRQPHRYGQLDEILAREVVNSGVNLSTGLLTPVDEGHLIVLSDKQNHIVTGIDFNDPDFLAALQTLFMRNARKTTVDLHGLNRDIYVGVAGQDPGIKSGILMR